MTFEDIDAHIIGFMIEHEDIGGIEKNLQLKLEIYSILCFNNVHNGFTRWLGETIVKEISA